MGTFFQRLLTFLLLLLGFHLPARSQQDTKDSLVAAYTRYQSQAQREKLFAHVDKSFYLAGEDCWFSIYVVDADANMPVALSGIAYIELLDNQLKPVLQSKVRLDTGRGNGSFHLPASMPSGRYLFRAYTAWMKNFGPDNFFAQPLSIVNTTDETASAVSDASAVPETAVPETTVPETAAANPNQTRTGNFTPSAAAAPNQTRTGNSIPPAAAGSTIQFFPEGGNLVNELASVVAFKSTDRNGNGIACEGVIYNDQKDTLAHFSSNRFGMGRFLLTPQHGRSYFARVSTDSGTFAGTLPGAYDQGYTIHLDDSDPHRLKITARSRGNSPNPAVYLFVNAHHRTAGVQLGFLANNEATFFIEKDSLSEGISHFTLFDAGRSPVCERLWCKPPGHQLHIGIAMDPSAMSGSANPDNHATATPDNRPAASFDSRHLVNIDLQTSGPAGTPAPASLSLSAILIDSLQPIPDEDILTYLLLTSDLKGRIEDPQYYFAHTDATTAKAAEAAESVKALDDLMLTQGWSRFRWEDVLQNKKPYFEFLPETNGPIINARVTNRLTGAPPPPLTCYLSIPGRQFKLAVAQTHPEGTIRFHLGDFYGNNQLIAQIRSADSNYHIDISSPFSDRYASLPTGALLLPKDQQNALLTRSIAVQAGNAYFGEQISHSVLPRALDTLGFYGAADRNYNLDDYTRFVTMDEVIREYVEDVRVRRESGKAFFRVRNALFNLFFDDDPLLLVDGVPVFDQDKMIGINPLRIQKIDVVSHRYFLGPSISDGLISFRSYDGDLGGYQLDPNAVVVQYNGLDQLREFYSPVYTSAAQTKSPIPDLRNQLLWSPAITTGADGKQRIALYTSDLKGKYAVIVQGITKDGLAGHATLTFSVQ